MTSLAGAHSAGVYETVVQNALPTLSSAIGSARLEESWIAGSAIDLVTSLVRGSPASGLGEGFFTLLAPNLFACLKETEDRDVLQVSIMHNKNARFNIGNLERCHLLDYYYP